jgi:Cofactor assembly of complex C subunit B
MNMTILASTLLLTILSLVGLFFFIKASVKDRTQQVLLGSEQPEESLVAQLRQYFTARAYRVTSVDRETNQVTFCGFVRPSWFLAIFLTLLATAGILCFVLVLSFLFPSQASWFAILEVLAPLAGWFYWQKAGREERVALKFENEGARQIERVQSFVTITAHRDELAALQQALNLEKV